MPAPSVALLTNALMPPGRTGTRRLPLAAFVVAVVLMAGAGVGIAPAAVGAAEETEVTIPAGTPLTLDPALQSDLGSAVFTAQLFESLTAFDTTLTLRPALAGSWDVANDGRQVIFHLRPGLEFSDGTPIRGEDVVESWLRIIDPARPSLLASLLLDVKGAADHLTGRSTDPAEVGLRADGLDVIVDLVRPGADFPSIVASPTFGIVPPQVWRDGLDIDLDSVPSSGAFVVDAMTATEVTLRSNARYWAGRPAITVVRLPSDLGGRSPIAVFQDGEADYVAISGADAAWIRYDATLGPQLRLVPSLSLSFLGFTTDRPPFDDARVRQAFGAAVGWNRISGLSGLEDEVPADSMVPPGIPGGGDRDWLPRHDPDLARQLLADAGYPGGVGFPAVAFAAGGIGSAEAIAADLARELGVTIRLEEFEDHFGHLHDDPAPMWTLGWVADYPGANDFLGVLLGTGSTNNYGHWSSAAFDDAVAAALATRDPGVSLAAFERALAVVRDEVPVVPLVYGDGWALSRDGLLGADQNGLGILRLAGLAWR